MDDDMQLPSTFDGLMRLVARLRGPDGCPWDREQDRASMRRYLLEEVYELLDAMDEGDATAQVEELGDVMFHLAFQVQLGKEESSYGESEVFEAIIEKLLHRHPHVFGPAKLEGAREVEARWSALKREEKPADASRALHGVPKDLPALLHAQTIQERAALSGFDWEDISGVRRKVIEELDELERGRSADELEAELGDLLFSLVNLGRWLRVDAEGALRRANHRFRNRFEHMERRSAEKGVDLEALELGEKEALWEEAKDALG